MKRRFLFAPALLLTLALVNHTASAQTRNESKREELPKSINISSVNTDGSGEMEMNYTKDGSRYKVRLKGSKIMELYVDDKRIAESDFAKYEPGIKKILEQIEEDRKQADIDRAAAEKHRQQANRDREEVNKMREQAQKDRQEAEKHRAQAEQDREQASKEREEANLERERANKTREQAQKDRARAEVDRKKAEEDRKQMEAMFDELVNDKLVPDRESLTSLELDETKLTVNGKELPANIHQRYKQKYLKESHRRLQYRNSGGSRTININ